MNIFKTKEEFDARIGVLVCLILIIILIFKIFSLETKIETHAHCLSDIYICK